MTTVGFTGTQYHLTGGQKGTLIAALAGFRDVGAIWMRNGDCIESDEFAGRTWLDLGGAIHLHPPSNPNRRAFLNRLPMVVSSPPRPYLDRNRDIAAGSSVMVATPREMEERPKGGTWFTVRVARGLGLPLLIILPDGAPRYERWPEDGMLAFASADTRPEGGDGTKIAAPFTGGAVPHGDAADAQTTEDGSGNATSGNPLPVKHGD